MDETAEQHLLPLVQGMLAARDRSIALGGHLQTLVPFSVTLRF